MPQDTSNNESQSDQNNLPYMRDRHDDFQLAEVEEILRYPDPSKIMLEPPILPKGGEVYLYRPNALDRRVRDQYWWVNRGNNFHSKGQKRPTIMKTYFSLKDRNGGRKSDCLNGFRRHLYRLADVRDAEDIIFIHYLGDENLHKPMPHGNTKVSWYNQLTAPSRDTAIKTTEDVPITAVFEFPAVNTTTVATGRYQNKVMARNTTNIGSKKRGSISGNVRAPSNVLSAKPGVSLLSDKIRQTLDTNNRKRLIPGWNSNNKIETNKAVNNPHFLHNNSSPSAKMAKVTINGQQMSRTGQHDAQLPSQAYIHQSISSPVVSRRIKQSTPISSIGQQPRPQRAFGLTRQQVKPVGNQVTHLIKSQNSLHLSARTQEQQQPMKMRHLSNSLPSITKTRLPTSSQVILHEALQQEVGNQSYISQNDQSLNRGQDMSENTLPCSSNYILQNSQPPFVENSVSDDSTLPMDYEKFFEEASRLPRMGCDVFVLVSYPGCKPAYWGTEKYVKKFENSERLMPFSASGCLSIRLKGLTDKQNLLANNLELSQPIQRQLDELDSSGTSPNLKLVIKEESRENDGDEDSGVAQDIVKQEHSDTEDCQPLVSNRQTRIRVATQRPNNALADSQSIKNNISFEGKYQYKKQLNTTRQYGGTKSYGLSTENNNSLSSRPSLRDKEVTNFYDRAFVYKDETSGDAGDSSGQSHSMDKEHLSTDESMLRLPSEIVEPSQVLIKIEPQTDDYGDLNSLVYTEYG